MTIGVCHSIAMTHTVRIFVICPCCLFIVLVDADVRQLICAFGFDSKHLVTRKIQTAEVSTSSDVFYEDQFLLINTLCFHRLLLLL